MNHTVVLISANVVPVCGRGSCFPIQAIYLRNVESEKLNKEILSNSDYSLTYPFTKTYYRP